ncbi:MAG: acetylornithine/succinylornithine family transaminase [Planctomycetes bacterium]|nr:acetylornithine/succinylornithine family transaminase [Planctomycetota bacterium]
MTNESILQATQTYLMANYGRIPLVTARASGATVWDATGKQYLDLFAGFGAGGLGHCHPKVVAAIGKAAGEMMAVGNLYTWESQVRLAEAIIRHSFPGKVFYCHSGAEANEAAIKLARRAGGEGRYKIISFHKCFHGRTLGSLSVTATKAYQAGFEPMLPGNVCVPFGDLKAVENAIDDQTAGVIVEPIQGEGGVNVPTVEFMKGLRALCDRHKLTLICDEVWTAPARTGKWFAYQHYGIVPDVMTLAKAIGGGVPVAACVGREAFGDVLTPGTHGCTLGGNPVCAAAGAAVCQAIEEENLVDEARRKGERIVQAIKNAAIGRVKEIRGKGLMLGIELDAAPDQAKAVFNACLDAGVMINIAQGNVVRLAPPMVITDDELDQGLAVVIDAMKG